MNNNCVHMSDQSTTLEDFLAVFAKKPTEEEKANNYLKQQYPDLFPNWKK